MARKSEILRALETLPEESLKDVTEFIKSLKRQNGKKRTASQNERLLAKKQVSAIKKWAGVRVHPGFSGREHDAILYRKES